MYRIFTKYSVVDLKKKSFKRVSYIFLFSNLNISWGPCIVLKIPILTIEITFLRIFEKESNKL